jgi:hypothetical protein
MLSNITCTPAAAFAITPAVTTPPASVAGPNPRPSRRITLPGDMGSALVLTGNGLALTTLSSAIAGVVTITFAR